MLNVKVDIFVDVVIEWRSFEWSLNDEHVVACDVKHGHVNRRCPQSLSSIATLVITMLSSFDRQPIAHII